MTEDFEVGSRNAECGKRGDRRERYLNSELGMRKAERKKKTEVFEFGIGNAEFGKRGDRRQRYLNSESGMRNSERKTDDIGQSFEFGIGNAEGGKKDGGQKTDGR
jgi:hypothetical protein